MTVGSRIAINGVQTHYTDEGRGSAIPLVFVHPFPMSSEVWEPQISFFSQSRRTISYDLRGFGKSDAGSHPFTIETAADDLHALLETLKVSRYILCGLSMGGYIALRAAEKYPAGIAGLILADTKSTPDTDEGRLKRAQQIQAIERDGLAKFADTFIPSVLSPHTQEHKSEIVHRVRSILLRNAPTSVTSALLAMAARTDTTPALLQSRYPVLFIFGDADKVTPAEGMKGITEKRPETSLRVLPQAGHFSNLENPSAFNGSVHDFLTQVT